MTVQLGSTATTIIPPVYNVQAYGALGDNSHDDTTAIQNAINALKAAVNATTGSYGGQTLYFPPGYYKVSSTLDFTSMPEVRILGGSGRGGWGRLAADGSPPTVIAVTHANASSAAGVDMAKCTGAVWDGVSIVARGPNYAGTLLNFDNTTSGDVFGNRVQNCVLSGFSNNGGRLLSLDYNIEFSAVNVMFSTCGAGDLVRMIGAASHWSNANSFLSCTFTGSCAAGIHNPGPQTQIIDCVFEPAAGNVLPTNGYIYSSVLGGGAAPVGPVSIYGTGFWDVTSGSGSVINCSVNQVGWNVSGCYFDIPPTGTAFKFSNITGLSVLGCTFDAPGGGTPNIFDGSSTIAGGGMLGNSVTSPVVDNHAGVSVAKVY